MPACVTYRPVADTIGKAIGHQTEPAEERDRRKAMGSEVAMFVDLMAAGTKAADSEIAELRRLLATLERGHGQR